MPEIVDKGFARYFLEISVSSAVSLHESLNLADTDLGKTTHAQHALKNNVCNIL